MVSLLDNDSPKYAGNYTLQLGDSNAAIGGQHPFGENPSRTLFVRKYKQQC